MTKAGKIRPVKHKCPECGKIIVDDLIKHKAEEHNDSQAKEIMKELEEFK